MWKNPKSDKPAKKTQDKDKKSANERKNDKRDEKIRNVDALAFLLL